jgi:prolyl oligopeptidase
LLAILATSPLLACPKTDSGETTPPPTNPATSEPVVTLQYPETKRVEQIDDYHGTAVADPYRWLEDLDGAETRAWIEAQNTVTSAFLGKIEVRGALHAKLEALWNYERWSVPRREGKTYFVSKNDGLQNQSPLYVLDRLDGDLRLLLDPNTLSADGTVALSGLVPSEDGTKVAYGLSAAGSDWQEWRVRDVESGRDLPDHLKWIKFSSAAWTKDGKGFYYSRYAEPAPGVDALEAANYDQKVYFHRLGDPQSADTLVYERPDHRDWNFDARVSDDGRWLVVEVNVGTEVKNGVFVKDLKKKGAKFVELLTDFDASYTVVDVEGSTFYVRTDKDAPRGRLVAVDVKKPAPSAWREIVAQSDDTLVGVSALGGRFVLNYLHDAQSKVEVRTRSGELQRVVDLPGIGSAGGFDGKREDTKTYYSFTSFTTPGVVYEYDLDTGKSTVWKAPKLAFDPSRYETKQVFYTSKDGTRVPMFIVHKQGITLDGSNPTYLYGYGGFNVSLTPSFSVPNMVWLELGGVYAQPNLRGGGEYGEAWHQGGTKTNKQNVFDDFIAAGEWLIANGYTRKDKLAIGGRSNGGLLAGASLVQRPDLFGAALVGVGVLDMLRFQKFTIGWAWTSDYGSSDEPTHFAALRAYSPVHNVKPGAAYPATLVYTADHDDRVVPSHSYKFAAALQAAQSGPAPVLIRVDTKAGHGAGKPTAKQIEEWTDLWGFLVETLDVKLP